MLSTQSQTEQKNFLLDLQMQSSNSQNEPTSNIINLGQLESLKSQSNYFQNNNFEAMMMNLPQQMQNLPLNQNRMEMEETDFFRGFFFKF